MRAIGLNRGLLALCLALLLTACGFHLRGTGEVLPFESIYVKGDGAPSILRNLKRSLASSGVRVAKSPEDAQMLLELMHEATTKNILSLSGGGKVREYELLYQVTFRVRDAGVELWGQPQKVSLRRDFSYSDSALLAKEAEEGRLNADMQAEAVREVIRRVSSLGRSRAAATQ